ncbi:MAG: hypothetical protein CR986_03135 [Ignavibacteriae bacterium]|nr:MAG: hypothetical protein CR986_03135 [Ignavibacteriota bacterium]
MKNRIIISAFMGALAVTLGAFGAHGLKKLLTPEMLKIYETGVFYHLIHSVVLLVIALNSKYKLNISFYLILVGIILFSFSLYFYTITSVRILPMITPIGGLCLILGWLSIIFKVLKNKD